MSQRGAGLVLPAGSIPRIKLEGEELSIRIEPCGSNEFLTRYPDGYPRFHQAFNLHQLLDKISGQLKARYNLTSFEFKAIPQGLDYPATIIIGGVKYDEL